MYSSMTMRLDALPMSVSCPPSWDAKLSGMNSLEGLIRCRFAQSRTIGMYIATTGVLLTNAESSATGTISRNWAAATDLGRPSSAGPADTVAPVSHRAAATTNSAHMATTAGWANPWNAIAGSTAPTRIRRTRPAAMAVTRPTRFEARATITARTMPTAISASAGIDVG